MAVLFGALFSVCLIIASPAIANNAPADIAPQIVEKADDESALGLADENFRQLFNTWQGNSKQDSGALAIPTGAPVDSMKMTSRYGYREDPFKGRRARHKGIDLGGPIGTPIYATADGVIGRAQWVGGYGKFVEINHGGEIQTRYGHMSRLNVKPNQRVRRGDIIGFMGSTGRSTGSHLHYEVRIAGEPVNPMPFIRSEEFMVAMQDKSSSALGGPSE